MELIEQYEELIERSSSEISYAWKGAAIFAYFLSSLSAFSNAILFCIFWAEICGGHCYFWSDMHYYKDLIIVPNKTERPENFSYDWTEDIVVVHQSQFYCNCFHFCSLTSCAVAIISLAMFAICGKGGYDTRLLGAPWRLVPPALISSLLMMIMTMITINSFSHAYFHFSEKLYQLARDISKHVDIPFPYKLRCDVFQKFTQKHNVANYNCCTIYWMIQMCSWTMTWSWIANFFILLVRVLMSVDFSLLKVKIYSLPEAGPQRDMILKMIHEGKTSTLVPHSQDHHAATPRQKRKRREKVL